MGTRWAALCPSEQVLRLVLAGKLAPQLGHALPITTGAGAWPHAWLCRQVPGVTQSIAQHLGKEGGAVSRNAPGTVGPKGRAS